MNIERLSNRSVTEETSSPRPPTASAFGGGLGAAEEHGLLVLGEGGLDVVVVRGAARGSHRLPFGTGCQVP
ncbi:hypothetical protein [Streptomyces sp. NBC_01615]|uniref:hypothetical protein n=1 Tax=Streptomyces sp. NBC_01615 TaxID=2975898 RepID=UPI00386E887A